MAKIITIECRTCKKEFRGPKGRRHCSRDCKPSGKINKVCPCGAIFSVYKSQQSNYKYCGKTCTAKTSRIVENMCEGCHTVFTRPEHYGTGRFCSDACRKGWFSQAFHGENSPHWGKKKYSKNRREAILAGENIDRLAVFEYHNWICCICNEEIDKSLRFPHKMAATLEHKIPLSKGGQHIWSNVAPAHALCNHNKGSSL